MPIKLYDTQDAIPEAQRSAAIETKDGKWAAEEATDPTLGAAGTAALEKERTARKEAELARKTAEKERDDLKRSAEAKAKGISEEELQKIKDAEALARKPIEDENAKLKAENRKLKLTDRVQALALKHGVMPDRIEDAMTLLDGRADLTDADSIVVKDKAGAVTTEAIDAFLSQTFKKEKPYLYSGTGSSGGGSAGSEGGGGDTGAYDPVKEGKALADKQKQGQKENEMAFR